MSAPLRVAVADDERDIRQFLVQVVQRLGHQVVCAAASGRELLEQCLSQPPDLVISDIRMPELSGEEAARVLQQQCCIPVILITAQPHAAPAAEAPWRLVLTKPLSSQELVSAIERVLGVRAMGEPPRPPAVSAADQEARMTGPARPAL